MASSTPSPSGAVGGAEEDIVAPSSAAAGDADDGGAGGEDWAVALVLGVFVGIFVLGACWCWCSHLRRKKRNRDIRSGSKGAIGTGKGASKEASATTAAVAATAPPRRGRSVVDIGVHLDVDEESATVPVSQGTSGDAAAGMMATSVRPPGHDGALPTSAAEPAEPATYRGNNPPASNKIEDFLPERALSTHSSSSSSSFSSLNSGTVPTSLDITAAGEGGAVSAGGGALVTLTTAKGVSSFATPVNYGEFPQPFSGLDVPVMPYERTNSRSSNSFPAVSDDEGGSGGEQHEGGGGGAGGGGGGGAFFVSAGGQSGTAEGGREEGWAAPPEIDVADLVMDNNEFYTPHGSRAAGKTSGHHGNSNSIGDNEALREAVVMVAVAAAETQALRRKSSYGAASIGGTRSFESFGDGDAAAVHNGGSRVSADTRSSAENTDNFYGTPSARRDRSLAEAAVEAAAVAAAQAAAAVSVESDTGAWDASFSTDQGETTARGFVAPSTGPGPARGSRSNGVTVGGEEGDGGDDGGGMPLTPRSLPGLLSMSFSTSLIEESFGQQPLSPSSAFVRSQSRESDNFGHNDSPPGGSDRTLRQPAAQATDDDDSGKMPPPPPPPPSADASGPKQQLLQKFRRSSSRYSSEFDGDGGGMVLPSLPEVGDCGAIGGGGSGGGGSVRYPFLSNASTGVGGRGSYGGDTGPTLSRIPSSMSMIDSSEDESDLSASRAGSSYSGRGAVAGEHGGASAARGVRGKSGGENDDDDGSVGGGTERGGSSARGGGSLGSSVEGADLEQGVPRSSLTHDAVGKRATTKPWAYNGRTLRKIKSIDEGSDEQECFGSPPGLFPLSSSISSTARFFRSGSGGGGTGPVSGVFNSCVGVTPPATPNAAAAAAAAAAREGEGGVARKALQQAHNFDSGRLTDTVGWHGGGGGDGGGGGGGGGGGDAVKTGDDKPGDMDFDTGPLFLRGGDADGTSQVHAPREGGVAKAGGGGGGGDSASTGLFDSTKKWFDSVSTVIAGELGSQGDGHGQNNVAVEPSSLNNTE